MKQRGKYGAGAGRLKVILTSKLSPDKSNPLNTGLMRALQHVQAFLYSESEDEVQFEALKELVRNAILDSQHHFESATSSPVRQRLTVSAPSGRPTQPYPGQGPFAAPGPSSSSSPRGEGPPGSSAGMPLVPSSMRQSLQVPAHGANQSPVRGRARAGRRSMGLVSASVQQAGPHGGAGPSTSYARRAQEAEEDALLAEASQKKAAASLDWTLPQFALNRRANLIDNDFNRMTVVQGELERRAEQLQQERARAKMQQRRATLDVQMAELQARRDAEVALKLQQAKESAELLRTLEREKVEAKIQAEAKGAAMRALFKGQVDEARQRQRDEEVAAERETKIDRARARAIARAEAEEKARKAAENRLYLQGVQSEFRAAIAAKEEALHAEHAEEKRLAAEAIRMMDEREARRVQELEARAAKQRAVYERAGGKALEMSLLEQAKLAAEKAARDQAQYEAQVIAKEQAKAEHTRRELEAQKASVAGQLQEKERQRQQRLEDMQLAKAAIDATVAADRAKMKEEKAELRKRQAEMRAFMQQQLVEEHQRRFEQRTCPAPAGDAWVHQKEIAGQRAGFVNFNAFGSYGQDAKERRTYTAPLAPGVALA